MRIQRIKLVYEIKLQPGEALVVLPLDKTAMAFTSNIVHSDPNILGGTPVFVGTRVSMKTLLDYFKAGDSLNEFELAKDMLAAYANSA